MGTLWTNGLIYTMEKENVRVEAVYTEGDLIIDMGNSAQLKRDYSNRIEREIDLNGQMMIPGLVDSHMHLVGYGELLMRLNLSAMTNRQDVLDAVKEKCEGAAPGKWIVAEGWNENEWDNTELILLDELDKVSPENPVILKRICRHALVVNSQGLNAAGNSIKDVPPAGGVIGRYQDGRLNGLFKEEPAMQLITNHIPGIDQEYVESAIKLAIEDCWSKGLTGVHTEDLHYYDGFMSTYQAFINVIEKRSMPLRANLLVHNEEVDEMIANGYRYRDGGTFIKLDAMKIFADGSLGGNTALLSRPYADHPETNGVAIYTQNELRALVRKARSYNLPIAVHTIGDQAFENVLNAIEVDPPAEGLRDRLIHAQIMRKDLLERAKLLPVIFDIQPGFVPSDFPWVIDKVGLENSSYNYAWKTFLGNGIHCAGGSDAPIESVNPLLGIHAAVTRRKPFGLDRTVYDPDERLSMFEAVSLYTTGSAYATGEEKNRGKIAKGFLADFSVLTENLFSISEDELLMVEADMTIVGGQIVYQKERKPL
ncbi:amidohydrolase [Peribacillus psychrosaccharolyticus]|uniref:amidohydrolase n=1 Tax=Peribacillus psychrosaccharolyticus TaxID=1407 RepID=UPI003D2D2E50